MDGDLDDGAVQGRGGEGGGSGAAGCCCGGGEGASERVDVGGETREGDEPERAITACWTAYPRPAGCGAAAWAARRESRGEEGG